MKRFKFPFAYKPKVSLKQTIIYSDIYKNHIFKHLQNKYKCIYLDPAYIVDNKKSALGYLNGDRVISFDNKENNTIISLNPIQDNYLTIASSIFPTDNLITFAPYIKRDAKQTNLDSIMNWEIDLELSIPIHLNMNYFIGLAKQTFHDLINITNISELKRICKIDSRKLPHKDFTIIDAQKIDTLYPTLSLSEGFKHFCSLHKFVIVTNNIKKLKSGETLEKNIATSQDNNLSCGLYVYDPINQQPLLLINVCKRPDGSTSKAQLNESNPLEMTNDLYDHRLFNKKRPTNISLIICYSNLLFYVLDKVHLSEVVKSVWTKDFLDFINIEKIEIF